MFNIIQHANHKIAQVNTNQKINIDYFLDVIANAWYQHIEIVCINSEILPSGFFELKTRVAGEMLQKVSNYRVKLIILGDFTHIESESLSDFIYESNKGGRVIFSATINEALLMI